MNKKSKANDKGFVFSTDPDFKFEEEKYEQDSLPSAQQKLRVRLDTRNRGGKVVSLVEGFKGSKEDLQELGKKLKALCGTGGSAKDGEIIIQGDQREKIVQWLLKSGYKNSKKV